VKGKIQQFVAPWCVYALPGSFSLEAFPFSRAEATLTGKLVKGQSHGSCPSTRSVAVLVEVIDVGNGFPFVAENEG
jgi:hypothetical protein